MPVVIDRTPNPNALKFTVGKPVGGPMTFTAANAAEDELAAILLAIPGVVSLFLTADFATITKSGDVSWDQIELPATAAIEAHFG